MNSKDVIEAWKLFSAEFDFDNLSKNEYYADMFDRFESEVLYSLIRKENIKNILEFSPNLGWTSFVMKEALVDGYYKNKSQAILNSFDIMCASQTLDEHSAIVERNLRIGDVRNTISPYPKNDVDLLFIDCEHSYEFASWYCQWVIPLMEKGCIIWIHDWDKYEDDKGEPKAVKEQLIEKGILKPIINLMDYTIENFDNDSSRKYTGPRGVRSPSQILIKVK